MSKNFDNFNFDPFSTTIKTGAYTVPAGNYARVIPIATVSVDGVDTFATETSVSYLNRGTDVDLIAPKVGETIVLSISYSLGTGGVLQLVNTTSSASFDLATATAGRIDNLRVSGTTKLFYNHGTTDSNFIISGTSEMSGQGEPIWVTGSTDLDGDYYIVELYNKQGN